MNFRGTVGHELIHRYTYDTYMKYGASWNEATLMQVAKSKLYWGTVPLEYTNFRG